MSGGLRYRVAYWAERHVPRLVLRLEWITPTGRHVYTNVIGKYMITRKDPLW